MQSFSSEKCVSVGSRDRSARVWKILDGTQLVYPLPMGMKSIRSSVIAQSDAPPAYAGSLDCVAVIDEQHFVTGDDNGDIMLWALNKKKPQYVARLAHGVDESAVMTQYSSDSGMERTWLPPQPRWITCLASIPYTDVLCTGSWDGKLGLWKVSDDLKRIELMKYLDTGVRGVINGITINELGKRGADGVQIVLAIGAECRLGRWRKVKGGKNCAMVLNLEHSSKRKE